MDLTACSRRASPHQTLGSDESSTNRLGTYYQLFFLYDLRGQLRSDVLQRGIVWKRPQSRFETLDFVGD
jgi:hypothetical protein